MKDLDKKIEAYALKNAIAHKGRANPGSVVSALFNEGLEKSKVKEVMPKIQEIIKKIEKLSEKEMLFNYEKIKGVVSEREVREGLPELPNVSKKGVVMRIAPSASGPLHIGHAMVAGLNILYVKKYGGRFIVRIEDTNPENTQKDAYKLIERDAKFLYKDSEIIIQSDRMEIYYKYAEKLISKGEAYVCICSGDEFREFSKMKKPCQCRKIKEKENKERWKKMFKEFAPGEAVLRFKSSMTDPNPAMRDFPLARINETPHPRTKKKYRVWPLMNLAVTVDDIELGLTHILRGKDHRDNAKRQELIFKALGKKYPYASFMGIIHFKGMELSTTKMREGIESGKYSGWEDKSLPTLASLRKQGFGAQAFLKFSEAISLGENDKTIESKEYLTMIENFNK